MKEPLKGKSEENAIDLERNDFEAKTYEPRHYESIYLARTKEYDKANPGAEVSDLSPTQYNLTHKIYANQQTPLMHCGDCWFFNFLLIGGMAACAVCGYFYHWCFYFVIAAIYLIYLIDTVKAKTPRFLRNINNDDETGLQLRALKQVGPVSEWHMRCYHFETRTTTSSDGKGARL